MLKPTEASTGPVTGEGKRRLCNKVAWGQGYPLLLQEKITGWGNKRWA